jgi:hypothetical protein
VKCNIKLDVIDYGGIASAGKLQFNGSSTEFLGWFEAKKKRLMKNFGEEVFFWAVEEEHHLVLDLVWLKVKVKSENRMV